MSITFKTTTDPKIAAEFLAGMILDQLEKNKKVLWLIPGGSAIDVAVEASKIISQSKHSKLTITLTDERHGKVGHRDSNWQQLLDKGFSLPEAKLVPILNDQDQIMTTEKFSTIIGKEFEKADYAIGLFGIGTDGHTAGILPKSKAVGSLELVCGYSTQQFERITLTPKAIAQLDEGVVWAQGREKWSVLENFEKEIDVNLQPAQTLKKIPVVTIFTDYK